MGFRIVFFGFGVASDCFPRFQFGFRLFSVVSVWFQIVFRGFGVVSDCLSVVSVWFPIGVGGFSDWCSVVSFGFRLVPCAFCLVSEWFPAALCAGFVELAVWEILSDWVLWYWRNVFPGPLPMEFQSGND